MKIFETKFKEEEFKDVIEVLKEGNLGFGKNVEYFERLFGFFSKTDHNIATNSASASAFMIFAYLREIYGVCDVYTPSLAFTSPAWAAKHFGHNLIFVEVNKNLLFDCEHYSNVRKNNKRKKVLMPILYGGVSTIDNWEIVGDEIVVVDSAHCVTPTIKSHFSFFSFHPYKPICSSDGGMISTNLKVANDYFRSYRNFGRINTDNSYNINQEGFKFYMNNLNATIALQSWGKYYDNLEIIKYYGTPQYAGWVYDPLTEYQLQVWSSYIETADPNVLGIPYWAKYIDGLYFWRDLLSVGYFEDVDQTIGVDYPFLNGSHYINKDKNLMVSLSPYKLNESGTSQIIFGCMDINATNYNREL